jgi:putative hydrolase of the HAD superfamily
MATVNRRENLVIFDADDTLWYVEPLYDRARSAVRAIVASAGLDGAAWEALERRRDVTNVVRFGLSPERFPTSCVEAYQQLSGSSDSRLEARIRAAASTVFTAPAPVAEGAAFALETLASVARLALLTKGDEVVQRSRLGASGLAPYFEAVSIVAEKNEVAFRALLVHFDSRPQQAWSVGNSLRSDIIPAIALGMRAIWIDAHVWEYERYVPTDSPISGYISAADLVSAATIMQRDIAGTRQQAAREPPAE